MLLRSDYRRDKIESCIFTWRTYTFPTAEEKNKEILLYDGINIYLYNSLVMEVSIDFSKSSLFKLKENISIHSLINILDDQCIEYKIELNEEGEYDFILFNSIQVGFLDNKLSYIWLS